MTDEEQEPVGILDIDDATLQSMLRRATLGTAILGALLAAAVWVGSNWRNAAMLAVGAAISAASMLEWRRLVRFFNALLDQQKPPRGTAWVVVTFLLRMLVFTGAIYGSLKCFQGSVLALVCGLALAVVALMWEALRLLKA